MNRLVLARRTVAVALGLMAALAATPAHAEFLSAFTGHSLFTTATEDGHVSFSVFDLEGDADWTDNFGTAFQDAIRTDAGDPAVDLNAEFIYFYQLVNTNTSTSALGDAALQDFILKNIVPATVTSFGWVEGFVFNDPNDDGGGTTDETVGAETDALGVPAGTADTPGDGSPSVSGVVLSDTPFASDGAAVDIDTTTLFGNDISFEFDDAIATGMYSALMFVTTHGFTPTYQVAELDNSSSDVAEGDVPQPTPAPPALALLLAGLPGLALAWRRRKQLGLNA